MDDSRLKVEDNGSDNILDIENKFNYQNSRITINGNKNNIILGSALSYYNLNINIQGDNKTIEIFPSKNNINNLSIELIKENNQKVKIGKNFSCEGVEIYIDERDSNCIIGENNVFLSGIKIHKASEPTMIDLSNNEVINLDKTISTGKKVFVGKDVTFFKEAKIGDNCVLSTRSVISSKFNASNCLIEGYPANVVRTGITWDSETQSNLRTLTKTPEISLVTIVCNYDYHFLEAQLNSIERYAKNINFIEHLIICNDDLLADKVRNLLVNLNYSIPVVIKDREGMLKPENKVLRGWYTQQVLKLIAHKYVQSDLYLVLDSKNFLINEIQPVDLFSDGKPILYTMKERRVWGEILKTTSKKLHLDPDSIIWFSSPSTPFMMFTEYVRAMYEFFDKESVEDLICARANITEFILYYVFCMKNDLVQSYNLKNIKLSENTTLFKSASATEALLKSLKDKESKTKWFGVHSNHFKEKNSVILNYVEKLLLDKKIFSSDAEVKNYVKKLM